MWQCIRDIYKNTQIFTRDSKYGEEQLRAPITIGNGRYEIIDVLSVSGGYGIIYKAIDKRLMNRSILIKARRYDNVPGLFSYSVDSSRIETIKSIREEIKFEVHCLRALRNLSESRMPNLNSIVYDFSPSLYGPHTSNDGEIFYCDEEVIYQEEPYIVMQMIEGENLGDYVNKGLKAVMEERDYKSLYQWEITVLQYGIQIASLLKHFHEPRNTKITKRKEYSKQYYIYQDLKPDNIMISNGVFITLLDLGGMALVLQKEDGSAHTNFKNGGKAGVGTFGYKPPEFNQGAKALCSLDDRADIYSFGATLYHLLMCEPLTNVLKNEFDPIPIDNLLKAGYDEETYKLIKKCLEEDRENRFKKMDDVKGAIYEVLRAIKQKNNFHNKV